MVTIRRVSTKSQPKRPSARSWGFAPACRYAAGVNGKQYKRPNGKDIGESMKKGTCGKGQKGLPVTTMTTGPADFQGPIYGFYKRHLAFTFARRARI